MIVIKTDLDKLPENCKECKFIFNNCMLPDILNYDKTRHKGCPLFKIPVMEQLNI